MQSTMAASNRFTSATYPSSSVFTMKQDCPSRSLLSTQRCRPTQAAIRAVADAHHRPEKNPLTVWERVSLINQAIAHERFSFVSGVLAIPRPDLYWSIAKSFYPTERVICLSGKDDYERQKEAFWSSLGERTLVIDTNGLPKVSSTAVKQKMRDAEEWSELIPAGGRTYFNEINGYERFREAAS